MYFIRDSMNRSNVDSPRYWLSTHRLFKKTRRSLNFNNQNIYCTWKKTLPTCIYYTKITCLMIIYWILKPDRHSTVHLIDQLLQNGVILLDTLSVTWYSIWFFFFSVCWCRMATDKNELAVLGVGSGGGMWQWNALFPDCKCDGSDWMATSLTAFYSVVAFLFYGIFFLIFNEQNPCGIPNYSD